ncbi:alpha/beta hydrolase [Hoyosella sp. YIM 151337]|uniref:alpha/beta fold hydrolase n=1 Tax=Hoyosella sp. YIM 151337 TaxID=2992742 RepID=UPI0022365ABE|nr:alpha/beta hydrolase [Hoyosella sp. YIM 151337]MCW4353382.1 alpha/beta hydrolase [Hoyosella sp. YIM 151337]
MRSQQQSRRRSGWRLLDRRVSAPPTTDLPAPQPIHLPGRGDTAIFDTGPRDGEPLILLHALSCTSLLTWYPSVSALAARYRVIGLDQRWHGAGIKSNTFSLEDCADDVAALATELGIDEFAVAGYSMGSFVGQLVARRHADRLRGLVLCASTRSIRRRQRYRTAFDTSIRLAARLPPRARRRLSTAAPNPDLPVDHRWLFGEFRKTTVSANLAAINAIASFNSTAWVREIRTPTAVVVMQRDGAIPPRDQRAIAKAIPGARHFEVDAGHAGCVFNPDKFVPALVSACDWVHEQARQ